MQGLPRRLWMIGLVPLLMAGAARADVWAFVDAQGTPHFAAEQVDARYQLFFRSPLADPGAPMAPATPAADAAVEAPEAVSGRQQRQAWLERLPGYREAIGPLRLASERNNLDPRLLTALIATESGFRADAVSPKGALGLMQIMPDTASRYGVVADGLGALERRLFDPALNIRTGSRYLRDLLNLFDGQLDLALAAYNAGEGAVQRAGNRIPDYRETQNYVRTVLQLYAALTPPSPVPVPEPVAAPAARPMPGGALGRGNMIVPRQPLPRIPEAGAEPVVATDEPVR